MTLALSEYGGLSSLSHGSKLNKKMQGVDFYKFKKVYLEMFTFFLDFKRYKKIFQTKAFGPTIKSLKNS